LGDPTNCAEISAESLFRQGRSGGPALRLPGCKRMPQRSFLGINFALCQRATFLIPIPLSLSLSLSLSTSQHREFHSGAFMQGWRSELIFLLPFPFSLCTSQHRGSQHIHPLVLSLSPERALILLTKSKMTNSLLSPFIIIFYSLYPA
jgi:hypothetical protein